MGWGLWASSGPEIEGQPAATSTIPEAARDAVPEDEVRPPRAPQRRTLTRDEQAELELQDLMEQVAGENFGASTISPQHASPSHSPSHSPSSSSISPDSLYPTSMSCRQAFDSAFYCQSMGGQFNNVYRYGGIKDCSEHWSAFWFCMRTKSYADDQRAGRIRDFYRARAVKYKIGPSSEDVWQVRKEPVLGAFAEDPDATPAPEPTERDGLRHGPLDGVAQAR